MDARRGGLVHVRKGRRGSRLLIKNLFFVVFLLNTFMTVWDMDRMDEPLMLSDSRDALKASNRFSKPVSII